MNQRYKIILKALFYFAVVAILTASFIITLLEGIIMQFQDLEFDAMALYIVSILALIAALAVMKRAKHMLWTAT